VNKPGRSSSSHFVAAFNGRGLIAHYGEHVIKRYNTGGFRALDLFARLLVAPALLAATSTFTWCRSAWHRLLLCYFSNNVTESAGRQSQLGFQETG
jgi:hypothetical protein